MNNESSANAERQVVRVDLTSQDLRTGTIRLPRKLHGYFREGKLAATDHSDQDVHQLTVRPPRELQGLQAFLEKHELQTNDAIVMHVDGQALTLEPFYRRPQNSEQDEAEGSNTSDVIHEPQAEPAAASDEATPDQPDNHATSASREENDPTEDGGADPQPSAEDANDTGQVELHVTQDDDAPAESAALPNRPELHEPPATQDPFDAFDAFGDLDDFTDEDDFAHGMPATSPRENESTEAEAGPTQPKPTTPSAATIATGIAQKPTAPALTPGPHHDLARRPFTLPAGPFAHRRPASFAQQFASRTEAAAANTVPTPAPQQPTSTTEAATATPVTHGAAEAADLTTRIEDYLNTPGLPSILNAADLARTLDLGQEELTEVLTELAAKPDSRLSTIRPGFYLLKRPESG